MNKKYIFPLLSALFSAGMLLCVEYLFAMYSVHVIPLSAGYLCVGGLFLFLFVKNKKQKVSALFKQHLFLFIIASLIAYASSNILTFYSTEIIGATKMSFILQLEIFFVVICAILLLHEKITWSTACGGICIIAGGFLLHFSGASCSFNVTDIIALAAPVCFAVGIILNTKLVQQHDPLTVTAAGFLVSGMFLFCVSVFVQGLSVYTIYTTTTPVIIISIIGIIEGIAWLCYNKGLAIVGASVTSILFGTVPFITLLFSLGYNYLIKNMFIIPENIVFVVSGGVLIFGGIYITCEISKNKN